MIINIQTVGNTSNTKRPHKERDELWASQNIFNILIHSLCSLLVNNNCKQNNEDSMFEDDKKYFSKNNRIYITYESMEISKGKARLRNQNKKNSRYNNDSIFDRLS